VCLAPVCGRMVVPVDGRTVHLAQCRASAAGFFHRPSLGVSTHSDVSVCLNGRGRTGESLSSDKPLTMNVSLLQVTLVRARAAG